MVLNFFSLTPDKTRRLIRSLLPPCPEEDPGSRIDFAPDLSQLPDDVRNTLTAMTAEIEKLSQEKEQAIAEQDFERAAHLRDRTQEIKKRRAQLVRQWLSTDG